MLKRKEVERAFLGVIRLVEGESKGMDAPEESMTTQKPKWDQALPSSIHAVLEEFDDAFPHDLPLGVPPVCEGHEFKIDLEDEVPPIHRPLYKMSPLELEEAKKQLRACSSTASSDHQILPMVPQSCSYPRRMGAFGFVLTTVG